LLLLSLPQLAGAYQTKNVIWIAWDGVPRHFVDADTTPVLDSLQQYGTWFNRVINPYYTVTGSGHMNWQTGNPCLWSNDTNAVSFYPTLGECWLYERSLDTTEAWVVTDNSPTWYRLHPQERMWGVSRFPGLEAKHCSRLYWGIEEYFDYVGDWTLGTYPTLNTHHPRYIYQDYHYTDTEGHGSGTAGVASVLHFFGGGGSYDEVLRDSIMDYLFSASTPVQYKDSTLFILSTDHGRHSWNGHTGADTAHADDCGGCRWLWCYMRGPDIKADYTDTTKLFSTDVVRIVAHLMGLKAPSLRMSELDTTVFAAHAPESPWTHSPTSGGTLVSAAIDSVDAFPDLCRAKSKTHYLWTSCGLRKVKYRNSSGTTVTLDSAANSDTTRFRDPHIAAYGDTVVALWFQYAVNTVGFRSWYAKIGRSTDGGANWPYQASVEDTSCFAGDLCVVDSAGSPRWIMCLAGQVTHADYLTVRQYHFKRSLGGASWSAMTTAYPLGRASTPREVQLEAIGNRALALVNINDGGQGTGGVLGTGGGHNAEVMLFRSQDWGLSWENEGARITKEPSPASPGESSNQLQPCMVLMR
jgi:hypothetical protein